VLFQLQQFKLSGRHAIRNEYYKQRSDKSSSHPCSRCHEQTHGPNTRTGSWRDTVTRSLGIHLPRSQTCLLWRHHRSSGVIVTHCLLQGSITEKMDPPQKRRDSNSCSSNASGPSHFLRLSRSSTTCIL